ncbi:TonB-dependent receptor [Aquabacterium sp.]|uniref:TonB-dependent receptor n=1 Tax=Aquabacterium sp. TaxID=1872578 RepID=UPI002C9905F8|nr:TonB-dependent receptor [Aquabacterium sp.]HSW08823.1 TonB-dependent receptor [Aquabacterium sp.]
MSRSVFTRPALSRVACACLCLHTGTCALTARAEEAPVNTVVITGNPLGRDESLQPATVLSGDGLALRRAGTLGDTLAGLPGVASSGFGPQSARPVIRGLDGDRIRLLDNGGASADASNLSFDHAVAIAPLVVERIEVLRGPAALLYGGNATGGVVNTIDNRVPRFALDGFSGRTELRFGGAAAERAGAAVLEGGAKGFNWHGDVAARRSEDLRVPRFTPIADGEALPATTRVANSAGDSRAGAVGASWADAKGFVGAAVDSYRNDYGVTVEPDVTIRMRREQVQFAGERRELAGPFSQVEFRLGQTRYRHAEVEGDGAVGTVFRSTGRELRLQARHAAIDTPLGALHGVLGLQAEQLDFSALGEEAFVPATRSRSTGLFALEELRIGAASLSAGLRIERSRVRSDGDASDSEEAKFGPASERRFAPRSLSVAGAWPLSGGWGLTASLGRTERAPAYYELFANGVHVATGTYERGDAALAVERSRQLDLGLHWKQGHQSVRANAFATRFDNFIALDATGALIEQTGEDGEATSLPEYAFRAVPARLHGFELEGRTRLVERPWTLDANAGLDWLRGSNSRTGEPLPRLAPMRITLGLEAAQGAWRAAAQLQHAASQQRFSSGDVATPGYTLLGLSAGWLQRWGAGEALWTLKLDNAFNRLATNASALRTARDLAPLGGRALTAAVRITL